MTKGVSAKHQREDRLRLRKKRLQAAPARANGAAMPLRPIPSAANRPSVGLAKAHEPLSPAHYPAKRVAIGKRQLPGGADP